MFIRYTWYTPDAWQGYAGLAYLLSLLSKPDWVMTLLDVYDLKDLGDSEATKRQSDKTTKRQSDKATKRQSETISKR